MPRRVCGDLPNYPSWKSRRCERPIIGGARGGAQALIYMGIVLIQIWNKAAVCVASDGTLTSIVMLCVNPYPARVKALTPWLTPGVPGRSLWWPLWPPVTDPTTVPTAHGPVAKVPGRWGCGSAPGRRVSSVSGRI